MDNLIKMPGLTLVEYKRIQVSPLRVQNGMVIEKITWHAQGLTLSRTSQPKIIS
jgi:hypothetical protein